MYCICVAIIIKTCGYNSLIPFAFSILTSAAAERSREKKKMRAPKAPSANERSDTVQ